MGGQGAQDENLLAKFLALFEVEPYRPFKVLFLCIMSIVLDSATFGPNRTPSSKYQKFDCRGLHNGS